MEKMEMEVERKEYRGDKGIQVFGLCMQQEAIRKRIKRRRQRWCKCGEIRKRRFGKDWIRNEELDEK